MAKKNISVFGIYPDKLRIEEALDALRRNGFRNTDVSVLLPETEGSKDIGTEKHTKAPEGAVTGAIPGAVIGGALGWLAGIGAITIPGAGAFLAAGPLLSILAGIGAGGVVGELVGALIGMGIPEYEAKRYAGRIRKGGVLLSVHCDNPEWEDRAKHILKSTGADDIASHAEEKADYAESVKPVSRDTEGRTL